MADSKKLYVIKVASFTGKDTGRDQFSPHIRAVDCLFAIVVVTGDGAEIVDDGYRTREEAREAWPEAI